MKKLLFLALLGALTLNGCANRYKITLTNSHVITTRSRPKLDETKSVYQFKDAAGRPTSLPAIRVREIEPL